MLVLRAPSLHAPRPHASLTRTPRGAGLPCYARECWALHRRRTAVKLKSALCDDESLRKGSLVCDRTPANVTKHHHARLITETGVCTQCNSMLCTASAHALTRRSSSQQDHFLCTSEDNRHSAPASSGSNVQVRVTMPPCCCFCACLGLRTHTHPHPCVHQSLGKICLGADAALPCCVPSGFMQLVTSHKRGVKLRDCIAFELAWSRSYTSSLLAGTNFANVATSVPDLCAVRLCTELLVARNLLHRTSHLWPCTIFTDRVTLPPLGRVRTAPRRAGLLLSVASLPLILTAALPDPEPQHGSLAQKPA